jgi:copper chaperone CopZ
MKNTSIFLLLALLATASCNDVSTKGTEAPITVTELNSEINKSVAKIYVTGMTCKAGCGGKIEKELQALTGIKTTETLFEENRPENIIQVEFDPGATEAKKMEACIEQLMGGQYQVQKIEVLNYHGLQSHASSGADVESTSHAYSDVFKLLNVFQSLGKLLSSDL